MVVVKQSAGTEKEAPQEPNGAKQIERKNGALPEVTSKHHNRGLTLSWGALLVALCSMCIGMLTPVLLNQSKVAGPPTMTTPMTTKRTSNEETSATRPPAIVPTGTERKLQKKQQQSAIEPFGDYHPCTEEKLKDYLHDQYVPGFHIVCLDDAQEDKLNIKIYKGGMKTQQYTLDLSVPVTWDALKTVFEMYLNLSWSEDDNDMQPWAIFSPQGERLVDAATKEKKAGVYAGVLASHYGMVLVYKGGQFLWPGVRIGFQRSVDLYSIMPSDSPDMGLKHRTVVLETLSLVPLVLSVKGFLTETECDHIQTLAGPKMKYSDVVLMDKDAGRKASDFRTSQTTFLKPQDDVLIDIDYRTASLVRIPRNHQEHVQVLRYGETERYTAHTDYFDPALYKADSNTLRLIENGRRNRMATVFWYLTDVEEGGETVFPRLNGGKEKSFEDCETGLKVKPESGKVIIFYSLTADGAMDPNSLHGACRVKKGIKWAANKWVWNEPMKYTPA